MAVTVSFSAPGVPVLTPTLTDAIQAAWSYRSAAATSAASAATDAATITSLHTQFTIEYAAFVTAGQTFEINMANVYADFNADYALWQAARDTALVGLDNAKNAGITAIQAAAAVAPAVWISVTASRTLLSGWAYALDADGGTITLTLPANPSKGDTILIVDRETVGNGPTYIVARNGKTIRGLAEDMTIDLQGAAFSLWYNGLDWRVF